MVRVTVVWGSLRNSGGCGMGGAGWALGWECQAGLSLPTFPSCIHGSTRCRECTVGMGAGQGGPGTPTEWVLSKGTAGHLYLPLQRGPCRGATALISGSHPSVPGMANRASHPSVHPCLCLPIPSMSRVGTTCCLLEGAPLSPVLPGPALLGTLHF